MLGDKNLFPALPIEVAEFENMAVKLIEDGICTQCDLQILIICSHKISDAEIERRKKPDNMKWETKKKEEKEDLETCPWDEEW